MTEERTDAELLSPCSDAHCIMAEKPRRGMCTQGGCRHLQERGPELYSLLRAMAAEILRLRKAVER